MDFEKEFGIRYLPQLEYEEAVRKLCPLLLKSSFFGKVQQNLGKQFKEGYVAPVSIQWIDEKIGYGLFAKELIETGDFIGEYTGVVRRISWWKGDWNAYCLHYPTRFWSMKTYVIDAEKGGNETRFINHSNRPNVKFACAVKDGLLHLLFFAIREIKPGEQLLVNYGSDFFLHRGKLATFPK